MHEVILIIYQVGVSPLSGGLTVLCPSADADVPKRCRCWFICIYYAWCYTNYSLAPVGGGHWMVCAWSLMLMYLSNAGADWSVYNIHELIIYLSAPVVCAQALMPMPYLSRCRCWTMQVTDSKIYMLHLLYGTGSIVIVHHSSLTVTIVGSTYI